MELKQVRAKLNAISKTIDEHLDFLLEIRQDEQLYKDDIEEIGKMGDAVLSTLHEHHDLLHEPSGGERDWVCEKCGKSTFETDYDYLVHPTLHLGCALKAEHLEGEPDDQMKNFAEELRAVDSGHQPS